VTLFHCSCALCQPPPPPASPLLPPTSHLPPPTHTTAAKCRDSLFEKLRSPVTYSVGRASFRMPPKKESGDSPKKVREAPHHPPHPPPPPQHPTRVASVPAQLSALQGREKRLQMKVEAGASPPPRALSRADLAQGCCHVGRRNRRSQDDA